MADTLQVTRPSSNLPSVGVPSSTTQPIQYNLSASDIASPYKMIAQASEKASEGLEAISVPLAVGEADKLVRRDDQNNLVVDSLPPLLGSAARAARMTIAGKLQPQIENDLLQERLKTPYDPEGFKRAADAYKVKLMKNIGSDPALQLGVGRMVDNISTQNVRSTITAKDEHDTLDQKQTYEAREKENEEQMSLLARQEGGTGTREYKALWQSYQTWLDEQVANPKMKMAPERARLKMMELFDSNEGQSVIGDTQRWYQAHKGEDGAKAGAYRRLGEAFLGPDTQLQHIPIEKRLHYIGQGKQALDMLTAKDTDAIGDHRRLVDFTTNDIIETPGHYDERKVDNMIQRAKDLDDVKTVKRLQVFKTQYPLIQQLGTITDPVKRAEIMRKLLQFKIPDVGE
ncbi:MAG TPA: hypothetical protein VGF39_11670 [Stellaceae bacterium]|jgi:hypothetical protein